MTRRESCLPAPGPLEAYTAQFDLLWRTVVQRRNFRGYLAGLPLPCNPTKTLTALAGVDPWAGAQAGAVQRLQFFLSESRWKGEEFNTRRVALLLIDHETQPHAPGALISDETGDCKDGTATAHVARQYLGSVGKADNSIVAVSRLWADAWLYYPLHGLYIPASRLPEGRKDPAFRTEPQIATELVAGARAAAVVFRAVVADCLYGDSDPLLEALGRAEVPYVLALKPSMGTRYPMEAAHTPREAAQCLTWGGHPAPGDWTPVERQFRDGHTETWWAADAALADYGPDKSLRLVVATTDPRTLPDLTTWYLSTNLARTGLPAAQTCPFAPASLADVGRLYGLRTWVEQSYKQVKHELGWADFMVRTDQAIRHHWHLVCCAFSFYWWAHFHDQAPAGARPGTVDALQPSVCPSADSTLPAAHPPAPAARRRKKLGQQTRLAGTRQPASAAGLATAWSEGLKKARAQFADLGKKRRAAGAPPPRMCCGGRRRSVVCGLG